MYYKEVLVIKYNVLNVLDVQVSRNNYILRTTLRLHCFFIAQPHNTYFKAFKFLGIGATYRDSNRVSFVV